jgi:ABC-2 type transport system permease protein
MEAKRRKGSIRRLLELWRVHAHLDLMWMTRDTRFFVICYLSDLVMTVAAVAAMLLLAERFGGIGRWSKHEIVFMLGYGSLLGGAMHLLFGYNVLHVSRRLGRGQLDHTLMMPQPVWMTLLTEGFAPFQSSAGVLPGVGLVIWSLSRMPIEVSPAWIAAFVLNMAGSCAVMVSFTYIWGSLAFWAPRAAEEVSTTAMRFLEELRIFPLNGLGPVLVGGLMTVVPVGLLAWYPSQSLLGIEKHPWSIAVTPIAGIVFVGVAVTVFLRGMKHYGKVGSARYSSRGHRS